MLGSGIHPTMVQSWFGLRRFMVELHNSGSRFRDLGLNPRSLGTSGLRGTVRLRNSRAGLPGFVMRLHDLRVGLRVLGFGFCAGRNALSPVTFRENMTDISKT